MEVTLRKAENGQKCEIITERFHDGIHDKVCGMHAETVASDGDESIAFCDTHAKDLLMYVSRRHAVPTFFGRGHIGELSAERVNIKGENCECSQCSK